MKKLILIMILSLLSHNSFSQSSFDTINKSQVKIENQKRKESIKVRHILGFTPSRIKKINGLNFKYWYDESHSNNTNGLELDINPLNVFFPFLALVFSFEILKSGPPASNLNNLNDETFDKINGVRLGVSSLESAEVNGLELNLTGAFETKVNGFSMAPIVNKHYKLNGVGIGFIGNADTQVSGIQVGLFNKVNKLRGIQLGLWNVNDKRSLPFINWQFKD